MKLENLKRIRAPQSLVWEVTIDIERWPTWTKTVQTVQRLDDGPLDVGSVVLIKQPGLPQAQWRVTALTPGESFTWETKVRGIRMVATHALTSADGDTDNLLRLEMFGITATLLWPFIRGAARKALETENAGLKAACESLVSSH